MDIEPQGEAARELVGLDTQVPSPQAHPWAVKQSANEEMARDLGASAVDDGHTLESLALGKMRWWKSPWWKFPRPGRSQQWSALPQCTHGPQTPKKKTKWKSTPPEEDLNDW